MSQELTQASQKFIQWYRSDLLPQWLAHGFDSNGGVFECLRGDGYADTQSYRGTRSQAQMATVLALSEKAGWLEGAQGVVRGLHTFSSRNGTLPCKSDGYVHTLGADLSVVDSSWNLQDHAYFALSSSAAFYAYGDETDLRRGYNILHWVDKKLSHEDAGWRDGQPSDAIRSSRSHALLLSVFTFLFQVTQKSVWQRKAEDLYALFKQRFVNNRSDRVWAYMPADGVGVHKGRRRAVDLASSPHWACAISGYESSLGTGSGTPAKLLAGLLERYGRSSGVLLIPDNYTPSLGGETRYLASHLNGFIAAAFKVLPRLPRDSEDYQNLQSGVLQAIETLFERFAVLRSPGLIADSLSADLSVAESTHRVCSLYTACLAALSANAWLTENN